MRSLRAITKVMDIKEMLKEELEAKARKLRQRLAVEQDKLRDIHDALKDALQEMDSARVDMKPCDYELKYGFCSGLYDRLDAQRMAVMDEACSLEECLNSLVEAYKENKALESLKGRIEHEVNREKSSAEQKVLDSLALRSRCLENE